MLRQKPLHVYARQTNVHIIQVVRFINSFDDQNTFS